MLKNIITLIVRFFAKRIFTKDFLLGAATWLGKAIKAIWNFLRRKFSIPGIVLAGLAYFYYGTWDNYRGSQKAVSQLGKDKTILSLKIEALQHDTMLYRQDTTVLRSMIKEHQILHYKQRDTAIQLKNALTKCTKENIKLNAKLDTTRKSFFQRLFN